MIFEVSLYEVNMYIRDYRLNNNGEYPAPTKVSEKKLKLFLYQQRRSFESSKRLRRIRNFIEKDKEKYTPEKFTEVLNSKIKIITERCGLRWENMLERLNNPYIDEDRYIANEYKDTIKHHLEKKRPKVFEKYLKTRLNGMKRELLETSAKICMNPARIQRLLEENVLDLDDITTFYDL